VNFYLDSSKFTLKLKCKTRSSLYILSFGIVFGFFMLSGLSSCKVDQVKKPPQIKIRDDMGREILFEEKPQRIVSLAPNITEFLYALGCENEIVGITKWCVIPPGSQRKEIVGDLLSINYEKLLSLKPDVVLITVEGNTKDLFTKIESLGLKIFVSNPRNVAGIKKTIQDLASIFDKKNNADSIIAGIENRINAVKIPAGPKPRVMFFVSLVPLMAVGGNTFLDEIITLSGGLNAISKLAGNYPSLNREEILKQNPDFILIPSDILKMPDEAIKLFPEWKNINACKNNNIHIVDADMTQRPGVKCGEAVYMISNILNKNNRELLK
jgi:iron complex transport system substrate-binding protein